MTPGKFNKVTGLPVVVPITSGGQFARSIGFAVPLSGTKTTGIVRCDQPRVLDIRARGGKRVERAPAAVVGEVLAKVSTMFEA